MSPLMCRIRNVCKVWQWRWREAAWRWMKAITKRKGGRRERHRDMSGAVPWAQGEEEDGMRTGVEEEVQETTMRSRVWRRERSNVQREGCCSRCCSTFESKVGAPGSAWTVVTLGSGRCQVIWGSRSRQAETMSGSLEKVAQELSWLELLFLFC